MSSFNRLKPDMFLFIPYSKFVLPYSYSMEAVMFLVASFVLASLAAVLG